MAGGKPRPTVEMIDKDGNTVYADHEDVARLKKEKGWKVKKAEKEPSE